MTKNKIMFQNKKGFTLIELMVVIAIIAILATVVLVALQGARDAAEDSKRKSAVTQIRSIAEIYYATKGDQKYTDFDAQTVEGVYDEKDLDHLMSNVDFDITVGAGDNSYCASTPLKSNPDEIFCISNVEGPETYDTSVDDVDVICSPTTPTCTTP